MEKHSEFLCLSAKSMIRYSIAELVYIFNDDSRFHKLKRLNNTIAGKIARNVLVANKIILFKTNFILDNSAKLNAEKRVEIENCGIDSFIESSLKNEIEIAVKAILENISDLK